MTVRTRLNRASAGQARARPESGSRCHGRRHHHPLPRRDGRAEATEQRRLARQSQPKWGQSPERAAGGQPDGRRASTFQDPLSSRRRLGSLVLVTDPLRQASTDELFGELRRRRPEIDDLVLRQQLGLDRHHRDAAASLRTLALIALTVISLVLIAFIVWLTMDGTEVPDLVSGLTGSAIGAIVGILSGGAGSGGSPRMP
jgi:hypothetical protein